MKLLYHLLLTPLTAAFASGDDTIQNFPHLVNWFTSNGGKIDTRITLGYEPSNIRGMIATERIEAGAVLTYTPGSLIISPPNGKHGCGLIDRVIDELELGTESQWDMYFKFDGSTAVTNDSDQQKVEHTRIPSHWNKEGEIGSRAILELQGLPPTGETHRHIDWYTRACNDGEDVTDTQLQAFMMFLTRSSDRGLVPLYDLFNHHNGLINTRLEVDEEGGMSVIASTTIEANEPIYNTYARAGGESTVDIFNQYGFVEDYPQLWRWADVDLTRLTEEDPNHSFDRYVNPSEGEMGDGIDTNGLGFEPNSHHYEVLVLSPTLAALHPTTTLVNVLGNRRRTKDEWESEIESHHASLRQSHANAIHDSAVQILSELPTTMEEDEKIILPNERRLFEKVKKKGRLDKSKADTIQAIEYRIAFKKALELAVAAAESGKFYADLDEL